eukprot:TRINITY_DN9386_c0_g1_i2.p1 TRINITY_DN9386_c0_g1~~TRINITY_DN9386_c0_g1_i2.p1  ORF type:complete len:290 (-),score=44.37 TRINITY_DN9386_c0_g1_i2:722-1591(-)
MRTSRAVRQAASSFAGGMCPCLFQKNVPYFNRGMTRNGILMEHSARLNQNNYIIGGRRERIASAQKRFAGQMQKGEIPDATDADYAFEMAGTNIRYGYGATREVGYDMKDLGCKNVLVFTDKNLRKLPQINTVLQSLKESGINFTIFDDVSIEPTDSSFKQAIKFTIEKGKEICDSGAFDGFVALGGGSVMDTAKCANLYSTHPTDDFDDYVNPPIGHGKHVPGPLKPLVAIPTTSGTGSEATGIAVFDYEEINAKTGIAHRRLKPTLGIVDPENMKTAPAFCQGLGWV